MQGAGTQTREELQDTLKKNGERMRHVAEGLPKLEFRPLRSWPAGPHPRQAELDAISAIPAAYYAG